MCGNKYLFKEIQIIEDGHVAFGDASKVEVRFLIYKRMT